MKSRCGTLKCLIGILLFLLPFFATQPAEAGSRMPDCRTVYQEIERELPGAEFERDSHIKLGRVAMAFVKPIARLTLDNDEVPMNYLSAIKKVDVATYRVVDLPEAPGTATIRGIESRMLENGWIKMLRDSEGEDNTWVFLRHRQDGSIRGLLVIELDTSELNIIGVEGRIDKILAEAIADEPGDFGGLFGP